jgi:predicted transport protein
MRGKRFTETTFTDEDSFEKIVRDNATLLFGSKTIYYGFKNKVRAGDLGDTIPDAFLFNFGKEDPEFYLVEVELANHPFDTHILPQITKLIAFFKISTNRIKLIDKLVEVIGANPKLTENFKRYLGDQEMYKTLKDIVENNQNILLILDGNKKELPAIAETYKDTWGKMVTTEILKQYTAEGDTIFTMDPEFESLELAEISETESEGYSETYHLEDVDKEITTAYANIKDALLKPYPRIKVNPQKYYISLRDKKNFAFIKMTKSKMHIVIMLPYDVGTNLIKNHKLTQLAASVQKFYNGPCFSVTLENEENLDEINKTLEEAFRQQLHDSSN